MNEKQNLLQAIALQENLRGVVDDEVIDIAIATLRERIAKLDTGEEAQQRKQVTIFFADLVDFVELAADLDPEEVSAIQEAYFKCYQRHIGQFGGQIEKFIGDAVMAVFGIPSLQEHDPENAVRAALEIQEAIAKLNNSLDLQTPLRVRIGINTGEVFVNYRGEGDFNVVGDVVNTAKRLEESSPPDGILIDHNTYSHIRHIFQLEQRPPLIVKGKSEPLQSYLVKGMKDQNLLDTNYKTAAGQIPMIGREQELMRLQGFLTQINEAKQFLLAFIIGDGGLGKTRLLEEFNRPLLKSDVEQPINHIHVQTDWQSRFIPYRLLYNLLATHFNFKEDDRPNNRQKLVDGLVALFGPDGEEKAHFIGQLIGLDFSREAFISGIRSDAEQIYGRAMHYLNQFLAQICRDKPCLIIFEDIQWADNGSLNMIAQIAKRCRHLPILLICSARPQFLDQEQAWLTSLNPYELIELQPLTPYESKQLSQVILRRVTDMPMLLLQKIVENAGGNPYYVEELVWMLIEDNIIYEDGQQWWVDEARLEELRVPPTLTGILQARLDRLSEEERQVLQRAAAIGRNFWGSAIEYLLVDRENLLERSKSILARLSQRKLIRPLYKNGNGHQLNHADKPIPSLREYTFQHPLLQEVTYNSILKAQRRLYHRQIADWFVEQEENGRIEAYAAMIAQHFDQAGDIDQAVKWYGQAAKFARNAYVYQEALENYDRALKLLPPEIATPERIPLYDGLGLMLVTQTRYDDALRTYQIMLAEAEVSGDLNSQATAWLRLSFVYFNIGNHHKALSATKRAEQLIRILDPVQPADLSRALCRKCSALLYLGQISSSLEAGQESLKIARQIEDQNLIALILGTIYLSYKALGNHAEAEHYVKEGLAIEERIGDLAAAARSINSLGELARLQGDITSAAKYYHRAYLTLEEIGDISYAMIVLSNLGGIMVATEDYAASLIPLEEVIARVGSRWLALPETYRFLAEAYLGLDNGLEALEAIQLSLKLGRLQDNPEFIGHAWRVLGKVSIHLGRFVSDDKQKTGTAFSASECFKKSISVFLEAEMRRDQAFTHWDWGNYASSEGDITLALNQWQLARDIFSDLNFPLLVEQIDAVLTPQNRGV